MSEVWKRQCDRAEQSLLLALADHADDNGGSLFPSQELLAWKTGYSVAQVRRILGRLKTAKVLIELKRGRRGRATEYRLMVSALPLKQPLKMSASSQEPTAQSEALTAHSDEIPLIAVSAQPSLEPPSSNHHLGASPSANGHKRRDEFFENVVAVCHYGPEALTEDLRNRIGRFCKQVRKTGTEAGYILGFPEIWEDAHPGVPVTIGVLINHWGDYMAGNVLPLPARGRR
jgi:hypothetical protein